MGIILTTVLVLAAYLVLWLLWMWYWWKRSPPEWQRAIFAPLTVPLYIALRILDAFAEKQI